jgi:ribosomal protein S27AE
VKRPQLYEIDLTKIKGAGDFPCPNCGVNISPEDETDSVYQIVNTKVKNGSLQELIILCNNCGSKMRLVGFLAPLPP